MKMKKKQLLISLTLVCFFLSSGLNTSAMTLINNVQYPDSIKMGTSFDIVISFNYVRTVDCLFGDYIWVYYYLDDNPYEEFWIKYSTVPVSITENRPSSVIVTIDTTNIEYEEGDTFVFKIRYINGYIYGESVLRSGTMYSEFYEITSVRDSGISIDWTDWMNWIYIGLGVLGAVIIGVVLIIIIKKRK